MTESKLAINRANWQWHVDTWRTTGMTQAAYCHQHNLNATTFSGWITRGRKASSTTAPLTTVPVIVQSGKPASPSSIVLQHNTGWHLTLPADVQITWLARLLNELA